MIGLTIEWNHMKHNLLVTDQKIWRSINYQYKVMEIFEFWSSSWIDQCSTTIEILETLNCRFIPIWDSPLMPVCWLSPVAIKHWGVFMWTFNLCCPYIIKELYSSLHNPTRSRSLLELRIALDQYTFNNLITHQLVKKYVINKLIRNAFS